LLQALLERRDAGALRIVRGEVHDHADVAHPLALLRAGGDRPYGCRTAEKCNELTPL
jgi:hypothetical protein